MDTRGCRDRRRRHRRQRRRLFPEHGRRIPAAAASSSSSAIPSYREASTARSAGGLRQQFSTPENIAMSQFTLAMFRRLKTIFGADADVGFREQGYLILAPPEGAGAARRERRAAAVAWAPTSRCWTPPSWRSDSPGSRRTAWLPAASAGSGEGWFDPPSLAALLRKAAAGAAASRCVHDGVIGHRSAAAASRRSRSRAARRIACGALVNAAGPWAGAAGRAGGRRSCRSSRASATSTSSTAARRPRRCIRRR